MYQQQKRYNTAIDKFSNFKLGMVSKLNRKKLAWLRRPQVAMHLQLPNYNSILFGFLPVTLLESYHKPVANGYLSDRVGSFRLDF